jgi:hypothetical protein
MTARLSPWLLVAPSSGAEAREVTTPGRRNVFRRPGGYRFARRNASASWRPSGVSWCATS